ncbi:MAG: nucleoside deaminase [bacterium]
MLRDSEFLNLAIQEADKAFVKDEVPVGAVIVKSDEVIAFAHNEKESSNDITAHAEILALRRASEQLGDWRLTGCTLYCTLEPCVMCAGAIFHSRIDRVVFCAWDYKWGGLGSKVDLCCLGLNHSLDVLCLPNERYQQTLSAFFKSKR